MYCTNITCIIDMDTAEMQLAILNLLMDELPLCNRLLLGWLFKSYESYS